MTDIRTDKEVMIAKSVGHILASEVKKKMNTVMRTRKPKLTDKPLSPDLLRRMNAYWRAANYLSVGQIYLYDNPLLKKPLTLEHIKPRLLGHCGTTPGLNFIYVHLNRIINQYDLNVI